MIFLCVSEGSFAASEIQNGDIAFARHVGTSSAIMVVSHKGESEGSTELTPASMLNVSYPVWSPDGSALAFAQPLASSGGLAAIHRIQRDGSNVRQLSTVGYSYAPSWTPDGKNVLFSNGSSADKLSKISADATSPGDGQVELAGGMRETVLANDGHRLLYTTFASPGSSVVVLNSAYLTDKFTVTSQQRLTNLDESGTYTIQGAAFSPDSEQVVFARCFFPGGSMPVDPATCQLFKADFDGNLPSIKKLSTLTNVSYPKWSPDGKKIVFAAGDDDIYTVSSSGTIDQDLAQVTSGPGVDRTPSWQPVVVPSVEPPVGPPVTPPTTTGTTTPPPPPPPVATSILFAKKSPSLSRVRGQLLVNVAGKIIPADVVGALTLTVESVGQQTLVKQQKVLTVKNGAFTLKNYRLGAAFRSTRRIKITVSYDGEKSQGKFSSGKASKILQVPGGKQKRKK